jgi:hypothetical protein
VDAQISGFDVKEPALARPWRLMDYGTRRRSAAPQCRALSAARQRPGKGST